MQRRELSFVKSTSNCRHGPLCRPCGIPPSGYAWYIFGRCVPMKGLDIVLDALKTVEAPIELDIFGNEEDGSYTCKCKEIAAQLTGRSRARFFGHMTPARGATRQEYKTSLFPTLGETFCTPSPSGYPGPLRSLRPEEGPRHLALKRSKPLKRRSNSISSETKNTRS